MSLDSSEKFVVHAFVEPKDGKIPEEYEGRPVFSRPQIEPIITGVNSAPLGDVTKVLADMNCAVLKGNGLTGKNVAVAIADTGINLAHLKKSLVGCLRLTLPTLGLVPGRPRPPDNILSATAPCADMMH